jgi:3-methyladenine DNA glycosylase AlkD
MDLVADLRARLEPLADAEKSAAMRRYLKTGQPMFGVPHPEQKRVVKAFLADHPPADRDAWEAGARALWAGPERELRYATLTWLMAWKRKKFLDPRALPMLEGFVRDGAWWDLVDALAADPIGAIVASHREEVRPTLLRWIEDPDLWVRRTAILCQLKHRERTDVPMLLDFCRRQAGDRTFWIRKAIGWALRHHARTDPEVVRAFLAEMGDGLSGLSRREAGKHLG